MRRAVNIFIIGKKVVMNNFDDLAEECLMIELGQMPNKFVLEQMYENNVIKEEQEEVRMFLNMCQTWSWA